MLLVSPQDPFGLLNAATPARGGRAAGFLSSPKAHELQQILQNALTATEKLVAEQKAVQQTAIRVEVIQNESDVLANKATNQRAEMGEKVQSIETDLPLISATFAAIHPIETKLTRLCGLVQREQATTALTFNTIEQRNQTMSSQVMTIQDNNAAIRENLTVAAQKIDIMEKAAESIKADLNKISITAEQIEEKKADLEQKIPDLQHMAEPKLNVEVSQKETILVAEIRGFWSTLVQKIIDYSTWFFNLVVAVVVGGKINIKKWLASHHVHHVTDAIKHPAAWATLGVGSYGVIQNSAFSMGCMVVGSALFYHQWKKNPEMTQGDSVHAA